MPYYKELSSIMENVLLWSDLRHEQGGKIKPIMKRLKAELERAKKELHQCEPSSKQLKKNPNKLKDIQSLRPKGPRKLWDSLKTQGLQDRMKGAWLGRAAGCTLGAPVEFWDVERMEGLARLCKMAYPPTDYWTDHSLPERLRYQMSTNKEYLRGNLSQIPVDDDITYTLLGLLILEDYGPDFTVEDVGAAWVKYIPYACTAEEVALNNLRKGVPASKVGNKNNPYQHWIGADIRSDPWAYAAPGWPEKAAELSHRDAYISHRADGIYGEMYFAAAIAAAFAVDDPIEALEIGLTEIPAKCSLAADIRWALEEGPKLADWRAARQAVDKRFEKMHPVHTNNNACLTVFGLILGQGDFTKTIGSTVAMGLDNDCTAATAGSLLGAVIGIKNIPEHWWKPFKNRTRTYMTDQEWFTNTDVVARFVKVANQVWKG